MKHLNCSVVFHKDKDKVLFCKRVKEPYKGLYNFVGGKVESGETSFHAAYRELWEETGIGREDIRLFRLMDLTYYEQDFVLEIYVGQLQGEVQLKEELNPLEWLPLSENFADRERFAGDQNIAHIINMALKYPLDEKFTDPGKRIDRGYDSVGIDGCKGGWLTAAISKGELKLYQFASLHALMDALPFDACLIDMVIGLQGSEAQIRPDGMARKILKGRASTVFPAPCRKAVYAETKEKRLQANMEVLHKRFPSQTDAIIPKIREVDEFLQGNLQYKNRLLESHPEVCFARLKGEVLSASKHDREGIKERAEIIAGYLPEVTENWIAETAREMKCKADDVVDSVCLAVVANLLMQGKTESIPPEPMTDDTGLLMQMVIPKEVTQPDFGDIDDTALYGM